MGSWRKVGAFLGLVPDDEQRHYDGDDYADGPEYQADGYEDDRSRRDTAGGYESPYQERPEARGSRPVEHLDAAPTQGSLAVQPRPEWRREADTGATARPVTVKLTSFAEARVIGEKYREGQPVILDMTELDDAGARRLVDFAAGLAFALHGSIDKVTTKVFMLLPPDTDLSTYESAGSGFQTPAYAGR